MVEINYAGYKFNLRGVLSERFAPIPSGLGAREIRGEPQYLSIPLQKEAQVSRPSLKQLEDSLKRIHRLEQSITL